jgi:L-arabinose isomerase
MSRRLTEPSRLAVFLPLALDWQPVVPRDLADDRRRVLKRATAALQGRSLATTEACLIASTDEAREAGARALARDTEVVLILATMAVLPSLSLAALDQLADRPVVVWAVQQDDHLDEQADHARIVLDGGTVGAPMLTSLLLRAGRPFELVLGAVEDPDTIDRVERALRAGAAARRVSCARLGRVGLPVDGYGCVDLDEDRLRDTVGTSVIRIDPRELASAFADVPETQVRAIVEETCSRYATGPAVTGRDLARAARAAAALEVLTAAHDLDAGALTCHVEGIRFQPGLGFAPCFALGRMTSRGVPWNCSSDLPASMAMLTLKALGAAAQYHELEVLDRKTGEFLVASSGEHDLAFAGAAPRLVRNGWFPADAHTSVCACFGAPAGPATLLGFAQLDAPVPAHRFVLASGAFGARSFDHVGTAHASFRFAHGSATAAWARWCGAGVGLHTACTPGDLTTSVELVGRFLGVDVVSV